MSVTFIPKQPVPTKAGVYYAREKGERQIEPVRVTEDGSVQFLGFGRWCPMSIIEAWFGPVPKVEEAST